MSAPLDLVRAEASRIQAVVTSSRWYLFGSVLKNTLLPSDIDLLVVCATAEDCGVVRVELKTACSKYPIHLLLMTFDEEGEVEFIQGQDAIPVDRVSI